VANRTKLETIAKKQIEQVRRTVNRRRDLWPELCTIPGINERWLRAFSNSQIAYPNALRFIIIEAVLLSLSAEESDRRG